MRRETGKEERVQVPYDEGVANHIGPESCVARREAWGEALTGVPVGQVLSRESDCSGMPTLSSVAEGNTEGCAIASALPVPRGLRPWHAGETSCLGTGRSHGWPSGEGRSASGRPEGRSR